MRLLNYGLLTFGIAVSLALTSQAQSQRSIERPQVKTITDAPVIFFGQVITRSATADVSGYVQGLLAKLRQNWDHKLSKSALIGGSGVMYATFQINRDGGVSPTDPVLENIYGNLSPADAKDALSSLIRNSGRFEHLPKTFVDPFIRVRLLIFLNSSNSIIRSDVQNGSDGATALNAQTSPSTARGSAPLDLQPASLLNNVEPVYPPIAQESRVTGTIVLHESIGSDGAVHGLKYVSGTPLLLKAALDGIRQWRFQPAILDGRSGDLDTMISVVFTLSP